MLVYFIASLKKFLATYGDIIMIKEISKDLFGFSYENDVCLTYTLILFSKVAQKSIICFSK